MTNLAGRQFIRISLKIQTDNKKAAEELPKREFQVKNIVIQELSEMTSKDLEGKVGKQAFEDSIKSHLNPLMQEGEIEKVYIVLYIIQYISIKCNDTYRSREVAICPGIYYPKMR